MSQRFQCCSRSPSSHCLSAPLRCCQPQSLLQAACRSCCECSRTSHTWLSLAVNPARVPCMRSSCFFLASSALIAFGHKTGIGSDRVGTSVRGLPRKKLVLRAAARRRQQRGYNRLLKALAQKRRTRRHQLGRSLVRSLSTLAAYVAFTELLMCTAQMAYRKHRISCMQRCMWLALMAVAGAAGGRRVVCTFRSPPCLAAVAGLSSKHAPGCCTTRDFTSRVH